MGIITVKPIPTREWKTKKDRKELVKIFDRNRKKSQRIVDERIHYMWFKYLQLCLDLERINYGVPKRGGRGKIISPTKVKVSKSIYRKWDLDKVKKNLNKDKYFYIKRRLTQEEHTKLWLLGNKAIDFPKRQNRIYPQKNLFSHVIGQIDDNNTGISGVEKFFDSSLKKEFIN